MTLTRALTEVKLIDKKVESKVSIIRGVGLYQKKLNRIMNTTMTREEFEKKEKEEMQSLLDLLKRKAELKLKISKANAKTKVKVAGKSFTINEVIGYKETVIPLKKMVLQHLKTKKIYAVNEIEKLIGSIIYLGAELKLIDADNYVVCNLTVEMARHLVFTKNLLWMEFHSFPELINNQCSKILKIRQNDN